VAGDAGAAAAVCAAVCGVVGLASGDRHSLAVVAPPPAVEVGCPEDPAG